MYNFTNHKLLMCLNSSIHIYKHEDPQKNKEILSLSQLSKLGRKDQESWLVLLLSSTQTWCNYCHRECTVPWLRGATVNTVKWLIVYTLCYLPRCGQLFSLRHCRCWAHLSIPPPPPPLPPHCWAAHLAGVPVIPPAPLCVPAGISPASAGQRTQLTGSTVGAEGVLLKA